MKRTLGLIGALLVAAPLAFADAPRVGVVTGTVLDPGGAGMPGATVQLISERGTETAVSGEGGGFKFVFVIPGSYTVRADLSGFQPAEGEIMVTAGGRADVRLQLTEVAGEEIVVTGEVPLVNKFDITGGGTTDAKELEAILSPAGRWHQAVLDFFPGVTQSMEGGGGAKDVEGNTINRNSYYIDGVDTSHGRFGGSSTLRLPNVAVGEIQLQSSRADAEYSRTMGSFTTATIKSGTNQFHGAFSAVATNLAWDSTYEAFPGADPPDDIDLRWEAALGGPIVRDMLWFFVSASDLGEAGYRVLPDGDYVDVLATLEPKVAKLDFRPSSAHSLSLTYTETPTTFPYWAGWYADRYSGADFLQGGEFTTVRWSWAISDDFFLDTAVASQETYDTRDPLYVHPIDDSAPPWSPATNNWVYYDAGTGLMRNGVALTLGPGEVTYPRTQGNVSLNWFTGNHDLKLGVDYQDTGWEVMSKALPLIAGIGYNATRPGGFTVPLFIRYYSGPADVGGVENDSTTLGVFVRDRLTIGDHWTFNLGLRLDDQNHDNDIGETVFSSTDLAPRATAVYDVWADSKLLLTASAGRYVDWIPMEMVQGFNVNAQGRAEYDQYGWNAVTQDFDRYQGHVATAANIAGNTIEPATMDQYTAGVEWAFHPDWAFKAEWLYYKQTGQYANEDQIVEIDGAPAIAQVYENDPDAYNERNSLTLQVRRRFKDGWTAAASYTWSDNTGTCYSSADARGCSLNLGRLRELVNPETGVPWSVENRDGNTPNGLPHVFKLRGNYLFHLGHGHSINVGGLFRYQSGRKWNTVETLTVLPNEQYPTLPTATLYHFTEPMGSRSIEDIQQLDLNASWQFPIVKQLQGSLLIEVANVTDEQGQANVGGAGFLAGNPEAGLTTAMVQNPRRYRVLATVRF